MSSLAFIAKLQQAIHNSEHTCISELGRAAVELDSSVVMNLNLSVV